MNWKLGYLVACFAVLSWTSTLGQVTKTTIPQPNDDRYVTEDFGNCTFAKGKDRSKYVQPFVSCTSGIEKFSLVPQEDGTWGLLVSPGDETERSEEEERNSQLDVTINIDDNDPHELTMLWPKNWNTALESLEHTELMPILDELRKGDKLTISRNDEVIEFDLSRANGVFSELLFEQLVGLSKVEEADE